MAQLRQEYQRIIALNTEVIVIGPEGAESFQKYWEKEELPFIGLPDPDHKVLDRYGQQVKFFRLGRLPAQILVDSAGIIRHAHYGHSMADIFPVEELTDIIKSRCPLHSKQKTRSGVKRLSAAPC